MRGQTNQFMNIIVEKELQALITIKSGHHPLKKIPGVAKLAAVPEQ